MITALVQFQLQHPLTRDQAAKVFAGSAPNYREVPGLIRKYYILSEDGRSAGGVYLWESREAAERVYNEDWRQTVAARYGAEPTVTWFASPVVVDNQAGSITTD